MLKRPISYTKWYTAAILKSIQYQSSDFIAGPLLQLAILSNSTVFVTSPRATTAKNLEACSIKCCWFSPAATSNVVQPHENRSHGRQFCCSSTSKPPTRKWPSILVCTVNRQHHVKWLYLLRTGPIYSLHTTILYNPYTLHVLKFQSQHIYLYLQFIYEAVSNTACHASNGTTGQWIRKTGKTPGHRISGISKRDGVRLTGDLTKMAKTTVKQCRETNLGRPTWRQY